MREYQPPNQGEQRDEHEASSDELIEQYKKDGTVEENIQLTENEQENDWEELKRKMHGERRKRVSGGGILLT